MNAILELLKRKQGTVFTDRDGDETSLKLLPPLTTDEVKALQQRIPCPIPPEMLEVFQFSRGFEGGVPETVDFSGEPFNFGYEELVPHGVGLAGDGFGNYWIADLREESTSWGPIFYLCHDAPVLVYQCDSLLHFVEEVIRFGNPPYASEIDDIHERHSNRIWKENPGLQTPAACASSADQDLRAFASQLDGSWWICDLRVAKTGDGFSWGRYGPKTAVKRFSDKRLFAYQKRSWGQRFRDALF